MITRFIVRERNTNTYCYDSRGRFTSVVNSAVLYIAKRLAFQAVDKLEYGINTSRRIIIDGDTYEVGESFIPQFDVIQVTLK